MTAYSAGPSGIVSHVIFVLAGIKCFVIHSPIMIVLLIIVGLGSLFIRWQDLLMVIYFMNRWNIDKRSFVLACNDYYFLIVNLTFA